MKIKKKWRELFLSEDISIEESLKNKNKAQKSDNTLMVVFLLISIVSILFLSFYTGFVTYHEGKGGHIYETNLIYKRATYSWGGIYGAAFGVGQEQPWFFELPGGGMIEANIFFECMNMGQTNLLFASTTPESELLIDTLVPASPDEINEKIGITREDFESAHRTYTENMSIQLGDRSINDIPAVFTYAGSDTPENTFNTGILKDDNGNFVFVAEVNPVITKGFNDRFYNYQFLLPIANNQSTDYHIFLDPFISCDEGDLEPDERGTVYGTVTDENNNALENVLILIGGHSTVTNSNGFYNLSAVTGRQHIIAILEEYRVYENEINITLDEEKEHNITLKEDEPIVEYVDRHPDVGPGEIPYRIERPQEIDGDEYWISVREIKKTIRQNEFAQETVWFKSFVNREKNVQLGLEGNISRITSIDKRSFSLASEGEDKIVITFFGNETVGTYSGNLTISGDIEEKIFIEIDITDKERIPVQALLLQVDLYNKLFNPGSEFSFRTDLTNLLSDREYPVELLFSIQNINGTETVWTQTDNVFLKTSLSFTRNLQLPEDLDTGRYVLRITANYLELSSSMSREFEVRPMFFQRVLFWNIKVWHLVTGLGLLLLILASLIIIKKRIEAKKKYHLDVDYSELPKLGPRSIFIGKIAETEKKAYMNLENFKTHTIVAGSTGGGKSFSAQVIIEEMLMKDVAVIVFDPTAQWTGMLRKLENKGLMALYPNFVMKEKDAKPFTGNIRQIDNARELIDIKKYIKPGEIQVFTVHKLDPKDIDIFVANTVRQVFRANFDESEPLKLCIVYDEVHRLLPKFGGSGEGFLQIERACREFRKWGIGVMLISQVLADFVGQIKANINTEVQMRTRDEGDLERIKVKYGEDILKSLVKASIGTGMVQNSAYNRGRPYFATFRPIMHSVSRLSDEEIEKYNIYNRKIDQITYELDQLEGYGEDVFDLRLELKLALDKVKSGNFNMTKIYIEGLEPRLKKLWDKLQKKPDRLKIEMVSEEEREADLKKAKSERDKFESENKKDSESKKDEKPEDRFKKDVPPEKILKLNNDMLVVSPSSLYSEIEAMKDSDFEYHVNEKKNDFADWIRDAAGDEELAKHLAKTKEREKILELLDKREKGEKLPKLEKEETGEKQEDTTEQSKEETEKPQEEKQEDKTEEQKPEETEEKPQENNKTEEKPQEEKSEEVKKRFEKKAPEEETFKLENGENLHSIKDFIDNLDHMPDDVFQNHVNEEKNDFANWIKHVFNEEELANKLQNKKTKEDIKEVFENENK